MAASGPSAGSPPAWSSRTTRSSPTWAQRRVVRPGRLEQAGAVAVHRVSGRGPTRNATAVAASCAAFRARYVPICPFLDAATGVALHLFWYAAAVFGGEMGRMSVLGYRNRCCVSGGRALVVG